MDNHSPNPDSSIDELANLLVESLLLSCLQDMLRDPEVRERIVRDFVDVIRSHREPPIVRERLDLWLRRQMQQ